MHSMTLIDNFLETNADITSLVERIALGPQEEIIEKIDSLNQRFDSDFRCTPTFRWAPGFYKRMNEHATRLSGYGEMKRKVSTYKNKIENGRWQAEQFMSKLLEIDDKLFQLRKNGILFQDNTDDVIQALSEYKSKIKETLDTAHIMCPNLTITVCLGKQKDNRQLRRRPNGIESEDAINYHISIKNVQTTVRIGNDSKVIDYGDIEVVYSVPLIKNLMARIRGDRVLKMHAGISTSHSSPYHGAKIIPNIEYTRFPYISAHGSSYSDIVTNSVNDQGNIVSDTYKNVCFGGFASDLMEAFWQGDMMAVAIQLSSWVSVFKIGVTNPLNHWSKMVHGVPEGFEQLRLTGGMPNDSGRGCSVSDNNWYTWTELPADSICSQSKCTLTDTCEAYQTYYPSNTEEVVGEDITMDEVIDAGPALNTLTEAELLDMYQGVNTINI